MKQPFAFLKEKNKAPIGQQFLPGSVAFTPPEGFEEQYQERLKIINAHGILSMQAVFWEIESKCREQIERAVMGLQTREAG